MHIPKPAQRCAIFSAAIASLTLGCAAMLTGCGIDATFPNTTLQGATVTLTGVVHGGQPPVSGSHLHLLQASAAGYGAPSTSLLTANGTTILSDSIGPYVTTSSSGTFSITGDYTCTAGSQVYLLATQGNPGLGVGGNNPNLGLMAGLGACPAAGNFLATVPSIFIDEVSTVATAYALAGFFTDPTHLATSGSTLSTTGITNAGANIAQLSGISTGMALTTTPNGAGTVPQAEINTLADILAGCVNSNGTVQACTTLFSNATSSAGTGATATASLSSGGVGSVTVNVGGASYTNPPTVVFTGSGSGAAAYATVANGAVTSVTVTSAGTGYTVAPTVSFTTTPTDTASAIINIAHNPGNQVSNLLPLAGTAGPYQPVLSSLNDFSIAIQYVPSTAIFSVSGQQGSTGSNGSLAVDASGNVWGPGNGYTSVLEISPLGATTKTITLAASGAVTGNYAKPLNVSVSPSSAGTIWAADYQLAYAAPSASAFTVDSVYGSVVLDAAFDTNNNVWTAINYPASIGELGSSGTVLVATPYVPGGFTPQTSPATYPSNAFAVAVDSANHVWSLCNQCSGATEAPVAVEISSNGTALSGTAGDLPSTLGYPSWVVIDHNNNAWISSFNGRLTEYSSSNTLLSGTGYPTSGAITGGLSFAAVDGNNTIWAGGINNYFGALYSVNGSGVLTSPSTGYQAPSPASSSYYGVSSLAIDGSGNIWALDYNGGLHETIGIATPVVTPITPSSLGTRP